MTGIFSNYKIKFRDDTLNIKVLKRDELVIRLLIFDDNDSALLKVLDDSDATLGSELIYIRDIINKIYNTKNRYLHISFAERSESKVGSTDLVPATLSLISQGSIASKLNNEHNVINDKARMP